jgi:ankyrin repeat protein
VELAGQNTHTRPEGTEWEAARGLPGPKKLDFVKLLLARGANPNARAEGNPRVGGGRARGGRLAGGTPFLMAAVVADVEMMRLLLQHGADPLLSTTQKMTALMAAAGLVATAEPGNSSVPESRALEAVKLCVELGIDVNAINGDNESALHGAAYRGLAGSNSIIQYLVDKGADINAKNKKGWTALTLAEGIFWNASNSKNPQAEELLRSLGAEPTPPDMERDGYALVDASQVARP